MKKHYLVIVLIFSLFMSYTAYGQRPTDQSPERKFTGTVMDGSAKTPMVGANVLIKTVTDSLWQAQ